MPKSEENEHAVIEEPESKYYELNGKWYVEITVPHPDDPNGPPQSMTIPVDNEWWAQFIDSLVNDLPRESWQDILNWESAVRFNG